MKVPDTLLRGMEGKDRPVSPPSPEHCQRYINTLFPELLWALHGLLTQLWVPAPPLQPLAQSVTEPFSPLSVLSFHLSQARGGVCQAAPETTGIPGLQRLVDQDHG